MCSWLHRVQCFPKETDILIPSPLLTVAKMLPASAENFSLTQLMWLWCTRMAYSCSGAQGGSCSSESSKKSTHTFLRGWVAPVIRKLKVLCYRLTCYYCQIWFVETEKLLPKWYLKSSSCCPFFLAKNTQCAGMAAKSFWFKINDSKTGWDI